MLTDYTTIAKIVVIEQQECLLSRDKIDPLWRSWVIYYGTQLTAVGAATSNKIRLGEHSGNALKN